MRSPNALNMTLMRRKNFAQASKHLGRKLEDGRHNRTRELTRRELFLSAGLSLIALSPSLAVKRPSARFDLLIRDHHVIFLLDGIPKWEINANRFSGNPRLKVIQKDTRISIVLTEAFYPGTDLPADMACELSLTVDGWRIRLHHALGGFDAAAAIEPWLEGKTPLRSSVSFHSTDWAFSPTGHLVMDGNGSAEYYTTGDFNIRVDRIALVYGSTKCLLASLNLALAAANTPSLIRNHTLRRTIMSASGQIEGLTTIPSTLMENSSLSSFEGLFDTLLLEAAEMPHKKRCCALVFTDRSEESAFHFSPHTDLMDRSGNPVTLRLKNPRYGIAFDSEGDQAVLLADMADFPVSISLEGVTVAVTDHPDAPALELVSRGSKMTSAHFTPLLHSMAVALPDATSVPMSPTKPTRLALLTHMGKSSPRVGRRDMVLTSEAGQSCIDFPCVLEVTRPTDLVSLKFHFINLRLQTEVGQISRLVRYADSDLPALIIVVFPPQHIAEETFGEEKFPPMAKGLPLPTQARAHISGTREPSPLTGNQEPLFSVPAGNSQLVFILPDGEVNIPFTLGNLLNWDSSRMKMRVRTNGSGVPPHWTETAIEAPYRVILTPTPNAGWEHYLTDIPHTVNQNSNSELWHTRLVNQNNELSTDQSLTVDTVIPGRAMMPIHLGPREDGQVQPLPRLVGMWTRDMDNWPPVAWASSLTVNNRRSIVANAAAFPVNVQRLMLSTLGAWMDVSKSWSRSLCEAQGGNDLIGWQHRMIMGRDQFVFVETAGYLYPFGHRAASIEITERKMQGTGAFLTTRRYLIIQEAVKSYTTMEAKATRSLPFKQVRINLTNTPDLKPLDSKHEGIVIPSTDPPTDPQQKGPKAYWPILIGENQPLALPLTAIDHDGNEVHFDAPMIFVSCEVLSPPGSGDVVQSHYRNAQKPDHPGISFLVKNNFHGQKIAFAPSDANGEAQTNTHLETHTMIFDADWAAQPDLPFLPKMFTANIEVPAVKYLLSTSAPQDITYFDNYISDGFADGVNKGKVFARMLAPFPISIPSGSAASPGLISPHMNIVGISRNTGPIGGDLTSLAQGQFAPNQFFSDKAVLLGGVQLNKITEGTISLDMDNAADRARIPSLTTHLLTKNGVPVAEELRYRFECPIQDTGTLIRPSTGTKMTANVVMRKELGKEGAVQFTTSSCLNEFQIELFPGAAFVTIHFASLTYTSGSGRVTDVVPHITHIELSKTLQWIKSLFNFLHPEFPSFNVNVTPNSINASLTYFFPIPVIKFWMFGVNNAWIKIAFDLPLVEDRASLSLDLASSANPCTLTLGKFQGSAYFHMAIFSDMHFEIDGCFGFKGSLLVNLKIASFNVHVDGFLQFSRSTDQSNPDARIKIAGAISLNGAMNILNLLTISVSFNLALNVDSHGVISSASVGVHVQIKLFFFHVDVSFNLKADLSNGINLQAQAAMAACRADSGTLSTLAAAPTFSDLITQPEWSLYADAFA